MDNAKIHIYCGNGKGKTTCAVGLAIRCTGGGGKVLFSQFMKDGNTGERNVLKELDGITLTPAYEDMKFTDAMNPSEEKKAKDFFGSLFNHIKDEVLSGDYDLLVMDEIMSAVRHNFVSEADLLDFLKNKPDTLEVVLTGRNPSDAVLELADYVTEMQKIKHPYDKGTGSRKLIEW